MNSPEIQILLTKLISLTNEREVAVLELSLAQTLFDLIAPLNVDAHKSVSIYHVKDLVKQEFTEVVLGKEPNGPEPLADLKLRLASCFSSGEVFSCEQSHGHTLALYPLNNSTGSTSAIIAIEASVVPHEAILMLLKIFQNFTCLINDNERDTLTNLLNRKTFEAKINKVLSAMYQATKRKDDKSEALHYLAVFDIDFFKKVNDEYGHLIGDEVLLLFAQLMTQTFRDTDLLFRFGGEEFIGVFECSSHADIGHVLERFRHVISQFEFPQVGKVTVSVGYTAISAYDASNHVIDRADLALYYAKNNGRNRICNYEQLVADGSLLDNKKEGHVELF